MKENERYVILNIEIRTNVRTQDLSRYTRRRRRQARCQLNIQEGVSSAERESHVSTKECEVRIPPSKCELRNVRVSTSECGPRDVRVSTSRREPHNKQKIDLRISKQRCELHLFEDDLRVSTSRSSPDTSKDDLRVLFRRRKVHTSEHDTWALREDNLL